MRRKKSGMSTSVFDVLAVLVMIAYACVAYPRFKTSMTRTKFVVIVLLVNGATCFCYAAVWVISNQRPPIPFVNIVSLGCAMVTAALLYSTTYVLLQRDIAPSR